MYVFWYYVSKSSQIQEGKTITMKLLRNQHMVLSKLSHLLYLNYWGTHSERGMVQVKRLQVHVSCLPSDYLYGQK